MAKTFSLDLGTASIGYSVRNTDNEGRIIEQLDNFGSVIFQKGVGNSKTGEFSYAAERTKHRSSRRLYQSRKYRIWETLSVLIEYGFCPLSVEDLDKWRKYDKEKGLKRQYPVNVTKFEQWVRLDFDGDGKADYSSPYQLRAELATAQLDFSQKINRFKLGRALYHIAQRRGFKSSKGETLKEQEKSTQENTEGTVEIDVAALKKSEEKQAQRLTKYIEEQKLDFPTVGCVFYELEKNGKRIRGSVIEKTGYQAVRSQYKEEIKYIFEFQKGLDTTSDFFNQIFSDRKDGSIFYKRPLRSQKGLVGNCTLETNKPRCPISHSEFEKFRAFAFINNIQYRKTTNDKWQNLTADRKLRLYKDKFLLTKANFRFEEIRKWLEKELNFLQTQHLSKDSKTINYSDKTNVAGCPISGRMKNLLGDDWENFKHETSEKRKDRKGNEHTITFCAEDIWHICFSSDDEEFIAEFAKTKLNFDDKQTKSLVNLWVAISQGYSMLSLKAIKNINQFLVPKANNDLYKGFIYTEAALLGKIPEILGNDLWQENEKEIMESISGWIDKNREEKRILNIANNLISVYKSLEHNEQFAYKNVEYQLDDSDKREILKYTIEAIGEKTWVELPSENQNEILRQVAEKYQQFFATSKRDYFRLPKLGDTLKLYLANNFPTLHCDNNFVNPQNNDLPCQCDACKKLNKLYHPSMVEFYKPAKTDEKTGLKLLESPVIGAFKNPMAMRTLHQLRHLVNYFIKEGIVDDETRIVVETARDLNDANMRWAIEAYQRERQKENEEIAKAIGELRGEDDIDKARLLIEQNPDYLFDKDRYEVEKDSDDSSKKKKKIAGKAKDFQYKKDVTKYKLWLEQGMKCLYTGEFINISTLFSLDNLVEIEHTIPRSISFDNSLANKTICFAHYNRHIKKNQMPTQLPNYEKDATINGTTYRAIKPRLEAWKQKVEQLKNNVEFWKQKSKQAATKETKDSAIRQKHLWQMELDYWQDKLSRFTMTEVTSGFKHSQLNDTRLITKYAYHYLKSVFSKVDVQKGSVTADFRKMLGVQSVDEKKSRDKHSHHAIDAAILSCIPVAAKRDRMLELFYKIQEKKKLNLPVDCEERELEKERRSCNIGDISNLNQYIEENILINHISKDQTLTPAKRKARKRGKEVFTKDKNGELVTKWIQGDSIRGQLHGDTFYGAITQAEKDENGTFKRNEDGSIIAGEQIHYVVRKELKYKKNAQEKGFSDLEDLQKQIVDKNVGKMIVLQCEGKTFKEACETGFYMLDKKGNKINHIRHIRCYTTIKNPLSIKEQTYKSNKEYKNKYYAETGDLYVMVKYQSEDKTKSLYEVFSLFDVSLNRKMGLKDIPEETSKKNVKYLLDTIYKTGAKVLLYQHSKDEITTDNYNKRLFVIQRFESDGRINLRHHLTTKEATSSQKTFDKSPDKYVMSGNIKDWNNLPQAIRTSANRLKFLLEGKDFEVNLDGTVTFNDIIS